MTDKQILKEISAGELLAETVRLKDEGWRLAAISCTSKGGVELSYSFDKDYVLLNLRILTDTETEIFSISDIYPYSFLYENEIKELFGVNITGIKPDFNDTLYTIPVKTPFKEEEG